MAGKKRILLLATGGTIACVETERGFVPGVSGAELLERIPGIGAEADFEARQLMNIDSSEMRLEDWQTMARSIVEAQSSNYDGVVITHGTDTMCYTASALSFMLPDLRIPVLLTGSQKPSSVVDSDGPDNLQSVCRFVLEAGPGVGIVFNRKLIHGVRAFKMYSKNKDAYVSRNYPILAELKNDNIIWDHQLKALRSGPGLSQGSGPDPIYQFCEQVALLKLVPNSSRDLLDFFAKSGYKGLVIEGFGAGGIANLARGMDKGIRKLIEEYNMPVVMISQCPYDGVNLSIYGIGEAALSLGVIPGNDMTTEVAVTKLMWALGQTRDMELIRQMVRHNYLDEISVN